MRNLVLGLSIAVALLAGCIIGATASGLVVPPVRAGTNPPKWEYKCYKLGRVTEVERYANAAGKVGFEMAGSTPYGDTGYGYWCFKRRLP